MADTPDNAIIFHTPDAIDNPFPAQVAGDQPGVIEVAREDVGVEFTRCLVKSMRKRVADAHGHGYTRIATRVEMRSDITRRPSGIQLSA